MTKKIHVTSLFDTWGFIYRELELQTDDMIVEHIEELPRTGDGRRYVVTGTPCQPS